MTRGLRACGLWVTVGLIVLMGALASAQAVPAAGSSSSSSSSGGGGGPLARAAGACRLAGHEQSLGPTYVTYLSVGGGASCSQGMRLVRSYYKCRLKHGGVSGMCSGVEGFRCSEHRYLKIKVQYSAHVLCTKGHETIRHDYTQFT